MFTDGKGSADFRLRHDAVTSSTLISMLTRLATNVQRSTQTGAILEAKIESDSQSIADDGPSLFSSSESSSLVLGSDCDSEQLAGSVDSKDGHRNPQLTEIVEIISSLYRFSSLIRRPVQRNDDHRVLRYIKDELGNMDFSDLDSHVRWHLQQRCPCLLQHSSLFERLVSGVMYRRKIILYHASHHRKLHLGTEQAFSAVANPRQTTLDIPETLDLRKSRRQDELVSHGNRVGKAVTFIETTASTARKVPLSAYGNSIVLSGVTTSQRGRRNALDIPPILRASNTKSREIKCPYCSHSITNELGKDDKSRGSRWR